jgi:hypothetical protein
MMVLNLIGQYASIALVDAHNEAFTILVTKVNWASTLPCCCIDAVISDSVMNVQFVGAIVLSMTII